MTPSYHLTTVGCAQNQVDSEKIRSLSEVDGLARLRLLYLYPREIRPERIEDGTPVGRSYRQAPEIDGLILLDNGAPGEWVRAEMTAAYGADIEAKQVAI